MSESSHTALVTGAGRNIGRAIALELAKNGCNVVINVRERQEEAEAVAEQVRALGAQALVALADVGDVAAVDDLARTALGRFERVDIVVNNAAIRPVTPFLELDPQEWHRVLDVDLNAAFYTARAFLPGMVAQKWGRIINLTGMNAIAGYGGRAPVSRASSPKRRTRPVSRNGT